MSREVLDRPVPPGGLRLSYGPHSQNFGELRVPSARGPYPLAISIHGGFWRPQYGLDHMSHLCEALRGRGIATWNIEYRRMTENDGDWRVTTGDALAGLRFASSLPCPIDWSRVIVFGFSAGGHLALWTAGQDVGFQLRAAVSLAGAVDLRRGFELGIGNGVTGEFLGVMPSDETYRAASPFEQIPIATRVRLIHGTADETVPLEISEGYLGAALQAGMNCELLRLAGGDHFSVMDPTDPHWPAVEAALVGLVCAEISSDS